MLILKLGKVPKMRQRKLPIFLILQGLQNHFILKNQRKDLDYYTKNTQIIGTL